MMSANSASLVTNTVTAIGGKTGEIEYSLSQTETSLALRLL